MTRSGDDLLLLYTGGTTGMPKGVMWRQHDLYFRFAGGGLMPPPADLAALREFVRDAAAAASRTLVGPPLMHGTGWFTAMIAWLTGGAVILLDDPKRFDPADLWGVVTREKPDRDHDRRRLVRQADGPRARGRRRAATTSRRSADRLVRRDVERGDQAGAARGAIRS